MKYKLNKIDKKSLSKLLQLFTEEVLSEPIKNNSKHFQSRLRGFRTNRVPMHKLITVYHDDFGYTNSILCDFLEKKVQELFDAKGISDLLEKNSENKIALFFNLKAITIRQKMNIGVDTILDIAKVDYDKSMFETLASGTQDVCELISKMDAIELQKEQSHLNEKIEKSERNATGYKKERDELKEMIKQEQKKNESQQNLIVELNEALKSIESDLLQMTKDKENVDNNCKSLSAKYETEKNKLELQKEEYNNLWEIKEQMQAELKELRETIEKLRNRQLSSSIVFDTIEDVVSSMKDGSTDEGELEKYIRSNFTKEDTLIDALETIQKKELEAMKDICNKMDNNNINEKDLLIIRHLENDICIEFLICKSMHSLCTRYLDQMAQKRNLYDTIYERS